MNEYTLPGLLDPEELATARKALRLTPGDTPLTVDQLQIWKQIRDTYMHSLHGEQSHPGKAQERYGGGEQPVVVLTKKQIRMSKFRR